MTNKIQKILNKINQSIITQSDINAVLKVFKSGFLSRPEGGPCVKHFENEMTKILGQKYCYTTNSGTSALHLAIASLGLNKGDEVIVPALANIADCSVVLQEGGVPIFADINIDDFNIDPESIKNKLTPSPNRII